jgi:hypothetical protein
VPVVERCAGVMQPHGDAGIEVLTPQGSHSGTPRLDSRRPRQPAARVTSSPAYRSRPRTSSSQGALAPGFELRSHLPPRLVHPRSVSQRSRRTGTRHLGGLAIIVSTTQEPSVPTHGVGTVPTKEEPRSFSGPGFQSNLARRLLLQFALADRSACNSLRYCVHACP